MICAHNRLFSKRKDCYIFNFTSSVEQMGFGSFDYKVIKFVQSKYKYISDVCAAVIF